jgi:hypothetical protein
MKRQNLIVVFIVAILTFVLLRFWFPGFKERLLSSISFLRPDNMRSCERWGGIGEYFEYKDSEIFWCRKLKE